MFKKRDEASLLKMIRHLSPTLTIVSLHNQDNVRYNQRYTMLGIYYGGANVVVIIVVIFTV